jgi:hypothetical protein
MDSSVRLAHLAEVQTGGLVFAKILIAGVFGIRNTYFLCTDIKHLRHLSKQVLDDILSNGDIKVFPGLKVQLSIFLIEFD